MKTFILQSILFLFVSIAIISCSEDESTSAPSTNNNLPQLSLNGDSIINLSLNETYNEFGASAVDSEDGIISSEVQITGFVDTDQTGDYELKYDVKDSDGQAAETVSREVRVRNDIDSLIGMYTVEYKCTSSFYNGNLATQISTSETVNNQFSFSKLKRINGAVVANLAAVTMTIPQAFDSNNSSISGSGTLKTDELDFSIRTDSAQTIVNCNCTIQLN